jgi:hypothetical protein
MTVRFDPDRVNYILRTYLPTWNYEERIEEMVRFCQQTDTRHVMLFTDAQHMVWNQLTLDEARHEAANMARAKERLAREGIRLAINSSYNMSQSRWDHRKHNDYDYWATRVDGTCEYRTPCLLDPKLEDYLQQFYKILAEVGPDYIYIDDDHRYVLMDETWGCFCDLHLQRFSEVSGADWNREALVAALKSDADVRAQWIDFLGARLVATGEIISEAVHQVDPDIEVGMMVPCIHPLPAMGHTITNVLEAFRPVDKPVVRPCIGPYSDNDRRQIIPGLFYMEFTGHLLGDDAVYTPEIETTPFTRLSKSMTMVRFHITQALLNRMNNPAISLCGYVGDSPFFEPAYVDLLKNNRAYFEAVRGLAPKRGTRKGIQFIWDFASAKSSPHPIEDVNQLIWPSFVLHDFLGNLGFSYTYDESPVRFLAGDTAYALPETRITELLKAGLILDVDAAEALAERGFADLIGCRPDHEPVANFGSEECLDQEFFGQYAGTFIPLHGSPLSCVGNLNPKPECRILSGIIDHDRKTIAPGVVLFENRLKGKIAVLPYRIRATDPSLRHLICYQHQTMFRRVVAWMDNGAIPAFVEAPTDFAVQCWDNGKRLTVCITNLSYDVADEITVAFNAGALAIDKALFVTRQGELSSLADQIEDLSTASETRWRIRHTFAIFDPLIIVINRAEN